MNSVKNICQAIRTNNLHIEECNILCARTEQNEKDVKKAFNDVLKKETENEEKHPRLPKTVRAIGKIPKRGEPHKMFTFCTRTVYLGADFYSTNSRTFIFCDSNINCLSVDISMDLEQILGRQRLIDNPWKNSANVYIKTTDGKNRVTKEEYDNHLEKKTKQSKNLLGLYEDADSEQKEAFVKNLDFVAKHNYYNDDYVSVNHHAGSKPIPVFNNLVLVSEMRAFEIQQIDFKDRFSVMSVLEEEGLIDNNEEIRNVVSEFESIKNSEERLKFLVKYTTETPGITKEDISCFLGYIPAKYGDYYRLLGPDRIKANSYKESRLKKEWIKINTDTKIDDNMIDKIYFTFKVGGKYSKADIKSVLKDIYSDFSYDKTAKASDLTNYFVLRSTTVLNSESKWVHGFEILGKR